MKIKKFILLTALFSSVVGLTINASDDATPKGFDAARAMEIATEFCGGNPKAAIEGETVFPRELIARLAEELCPPAKTIKTEVIDGAITRTHDATQYLCCYKQIQAFVSKLTSGETAE